MSVHHDPASLLSAELTQHTDFLRSLAKRLLRHEADAEDLVQETMAIALTRQPENASSLRPWLATVLGRRSRNRIRDRARGPHQGAVSNLDGLPGKLADSQATIDLSRLLLREVEGLGAPYTETIVLRYYEGLPPRAIADRMGVPVSTVQTRLARALEKLRDRLDRVQEGGRSAWMSAAAALVPSRAHDAGLAPTIAPATAAYGAGRWAPVAALLLCGAWLGVLALAPASTGWRAAPPVGMPEASAAPTTISLATIPLAVEAPRLAAAPPTLEPVTTAAEMLTITGRVFDLPIDGSPKPEFSAGEGVRVEYHTYYPEGPTSNPYGAEGARMTTHEWPFVLTDADGCYRIEIERGGLHVIQLRCAGTPQLRTVRWKAIGDAVPVEESVVLDLLRYPHGTLHGELVDLSGEPMAGKRVRMHRSGPQESSEPFTERVTDALGRFSFDRVHDVMELEVAEEDWSFVQTPFAVRRERGGWEAGHFVIARTGRLVLRCVDAAGEPAPIRNLWASIANDDSQAILNDYGFLDRFFPTNPRRATDASGIAIIDGIPAGVPLIAFAPQLGVQSCEHQATPIVVPPGEELEVTLRASRTFTVSGRLTSSAGEPLEGVWVQVCDPTAIGMRYYRTLEEIETDADGHFSGRIHPSAGVEYVSFQALHQETAELTAINFPLGTATEIEVDLILGPTSSLGGSVHHADGTPVKNARIVGSLHDANGRLVSMSLLGAESDESGAFPSQPVSNEPPGSQLRVVAWHPDYRPAAHVCLPESAGALDLRFTEPLDATVTIRVEAGDTTIGKVKVGWATVLRDPANGTPLPQLTSESMGSPASPGIPATVSRFSDLPIIVGRDLHLRSVKTFEAPEESYSIALPSGPAWLAVSIENDNGEVVQTVATGCVEVATDITEITIVPTLAEEPDSH